MRPSIYLGRLNNDVSISAAQNNSYSGALTSVQTNSHVFIASWWKSAEKRTHNGGLLADRSHNTIVVPHVQNALFSAKSARTLAHFIMWTHFMFF